jgi:hypothetical protein
METCRSLAGRVEWQIFWPRVPAVVTEIALGPCKNLAIFNYFFSKAGCDSRCIKIHFLPRIVLSSLYEQVPTRKSIRQPPIPRSTDGIAYHFQFLQTVHHYRRCLKSALSFLRPFHLALILAPDSGSRAS